jgi:hypothetical protein
MADVRPLTVQSGTTKNQQNADNLIVGAGVKTTSGNLGISAASGIVTLANQTLTGSGTSALDYSAASGVFKTSTGVGTFGGSANNFTNIIHADGNIDRSSNASLSIGATNATTLFLGRSGQLTQVQGNLQVQGTETIVGTTTFQQDVTFEGDTTFGNAATDHVNFVARVGESGTPDIHFLKEVNHTIDIDASTTTGANGANLTLSAGDGANGSGGTGGGDGGAYSIAGTTGGAGTATAAAGAGGAISIVAGAAGTAAAGGGAAGGDLTLDAGTATGAATDGVVAVGTTNANAVTIGRTGKTTTVAGGFTVSGGGAVSITGNAASTFETSAGAITIDGFAGIVFKGNNTTALSVNAAGDTITVAAGATLGVTGTGTINLPNNVTTQFKIEGTAVGATVTAANLDTLTDGSNADALHTHTGGGGGGSAVTITGLTTTGLSSGQAGYISSNDTLDPTDSSAIATARFYGFNNGTAGSMIVAGEVADAQMTTDGGSPNAGDPVYLADAADDSNTGAGKLTATPPVAGVIAEVGIVRSNANYAGSKTCSIVIQVKPPIII